MRLCLLFLCNFDLSDILVSALFACLLSSVAVELLLEFIVEGPSGTQEFYRIQFDFWPVRCLVSGLVSLDSAGLL